MEMVLFLVKILTWNLRMSLGFPAFFKQFWLHFKKNLRKNLKIKERVVVLLYFIVFGLDNLCSEDENCYT